MWKLASKWQLNTTWTIQSSPHLNIWAEPVHVDVAIQPELLSKFQRQLLLDFRWEITQGIAQSQLPENTHTEINKGEKTRYKRNGGKWVALNFNQTQLEACLSCCKDNAMQKAKLTPRELHSCFPIEVFLPAPFLVGSIRVNVWPSPSHLPPQTCMERPWGFGEQCSILSIYNISISQRNSLLQCQRHWTTKQTLFRNL